ncbi:MAG: hypothetical protein IPL71_21930 [Anaerolineales bacterium]|uniref:hypothetical protein n=1 Tax=Candidatus Villigracilis proximus TaxID=3140683 RepID=UPI003137354A|nr:hypothetical protein [Anaerolineales bacterium]
MLGEKHQQPTLALLLVSNPTDRFYPDFVCKLKDGRYLVVEYKGAHLYKAAEENRQIGELWEKRSKGQCLFVMPTDRKHDVILAKMK